jgi:hypothetical protein
MRHTSFRCFFFACLAAALLTCPAPSSAQSLNWDGQTGGLVTPFATVVDSPVKRLGRPLASFMWLDAGPIIGQRFQIAITEGVGGFVEFGYVKSALSGETTGLAELFDRGFQNVHGKARVFGSRDAMGAPAVAIGGRYAWQVNSLTDAAPLRTGDVYAIITKGFAAGDQVKVLLNGGVKFTNASLLSIGGNAPDWCVCGFAAGTVAVKDYLAFGAEILQQPQAIQGLETADIPPTVTAFLRVMPVANRLSLIVSFVRLAGEVAPGVDLEATARFAVGATFRF